MEREGERWIFKERKLEKKGREGGRAGKIGQGLMEDGGWMKCGRNLGKDESYKQGDGRWQKKNRW